jgi:tRNA (guanine-N7-)-methyltransferase
VRGIRQHVNPLGAAYLEARAEAIAIPTRYADAPIDVELGCAEAQFSFALARAEPERFVVGLEIREPMVALNQSRVREQGLTNLAFGYVNMNVDLELVFPDARVDRFFLLFPDPWFKPRHRKRRVVESQLLASMARLLVDGGEVHFASDVFELALDAMFEFESQEAARHGFEPIGEAWSFLRENPLGVCSRRERTTISRGQRVWRFAYRRRARS